MFFLPSARLSTCPVPCCQRSTVNGSSFSRPLWRIIGAKSWPSPTLPPDAPWTTISHWYGYPELHWQGRRYAGKRENLVEMKCLPQHLPWPCAIATDIEPDWDDYAPFTEAGWRFLPASEVCGNVSSYLRFHSGEPGRDWHRQGRICRQSRRVDERPQRRLSGAWPPCRAPGDRLDTRRRAIRRDVGLTAVCAAHNISTAIITSEFGRGKLQPRE